MKVLKNCEVLLGLFLLLFQYCLAQRGYNYARPSVPRVSPTAAGGSNVVGLAATPISSPLRPIVATLPTGSAVTGTGFATAPTAFGAPSGTNVAPSTTGFAGYQGNIGAGLPQTVGSNSISRANAAQRPTTGIFGSTASRGQSQFNSGTTATGTGSAGDADYNDDGDFSAIPGIAGVNYPIYSQVPQTSFDCAQQQLPGYYSDVEAQCQVFHICALNRTYSFLCPNGTIFSQETLVCVWWNQYDCSSAPTLYANNAFIYDYGNEGIPTNAASYQETSNQIGIGSTRQPSGFQIATNTARTAGTTQQTGIFGSTVSLRPTLTSGGYGGISTSTPATTFNAGSLSSQTAYGRRQQSIISPTAVGQSFSDTSTVGITPSTTDNLARSGTDAGGIIVGGIGAQQNTLQTAQLSTSSANREYLPPARRP